MIYTYWQLHYQSPFENLPLQESKRKMGVRGRWLQLTSVVKREHLTQQEKSIKKYKIEIKTLLCIKLNRLSAILQRVSYSGRGVWEAGEFFETSPSQELRLNGCGLISQRICHGMIGLHEG